MPMRTSTLFSKQTRFKVFFCSCLRRMSWIDSTRRSWLGFIEVLRRYCDVNQTSVIQKVRNQIMPRHCEPYNNARPWVAVYRGAIIWWYSWSKLVWGILRAAIKSVSNKASVIASKMRKRCKPSLNYCCNFVDDGEAIWYLINELMP